MGRIAILSVDEHEHEYEHEYEYGYEHETKFKQLVSPPTLPLEHYRRVDSVPLQIE